MSENINDRFKLVFRSKTFERAAKELQLSNKRVLDLGCGYGEFLQRFGPESVGVTTNTAEVAYGTENGLDIRLGNVESLKNTITLSEHFDAFWANNLFEHVLSPHSFLVHLKEFSHKDSLLILGVPVIPKISSLARIRKFRGSFATPHINFFTKETLSHTVLRAGWKILDIRSFAFSSTLLDHASIFLSPHVYIIAQNDPTYRYPEKKIKEWCDDDHYADLLSIMNAGA